MLKKFCIILFGLGVLVSCDDSNTNTKSQNEIVVVKGGNASMQSKYNYPSEVIELIDLHLAQVEGSSFYDCVRNEVYEKLNGSFTERELKAIGFRGRTNINYTSTILRIENKITGAVAEVIRNSNCIETWE